VWSRETDLGRKGVSPVHSRKEGELRIRSLKTENFGKYADWHYAFRGLAGRAQPPFPAPGCVDVTRERPPIYGFGSKSSIVVEKGKSEKLEVRACRNTMRNGDADGIGDRAGGSVSAIDCSGFVSASLIAAGLNLTPHASRSTPDLGTGRFSEFTTRKGGCLEVGSIQAPGGIRAGDILNLAGAHVVLVDRVGPDPLGIQKAMTENDCDSISRDSFDFTIAHSGSFGDLGPARIDAKMALRKGGGGPMGSGMEEALVQLAILTCEKSLREKNPSAEVSSASLKKFPKFTSYRHDSSIPGCMKSASERARLVGESCLEKNRCDLNF
jgi:hypothetical protein